MKKNKNEERKLRNVGKTLGLGIGQTYAHLFEQNEKLPAAKKLTDEQMKDFIKKEFPSCKNPNPAAYRRSYNAGVLYSIKKTVTSVKWTGNKAAPSSSTKKVVSKKIVRK